MFKTILVFSLAVISFCLAGDITYYDDSGFGACGTQLNANTDEVAAVSHLRFTTANPNNDPVCKMCASVTWEGKTVKVPIRDKCMGCAFDDIDLGVPVFVQLANKDVGRLKGAQTAIVPC